jgi:hypothetical protein
LPVGAVVYLNAQVCPPGYQTADGSNSTADVRGLYIRGLDASGTIDTVARTLASYENTMIQDHTHAPGATPPLQTLYGIGGGVQGNFSIVNFYAQFTGSTSSITTPTTFSYVESIPNSIVYLACERMS